MLSSLVSTFNAIWPFLLVLGVLVFVHELGHFLVARWYGVRVITFSLDREASMRTYNNLGISEAFHPLSHHGNIADKQAKLVTLQQYHTKMFAGFIDRIATAHEGDGTVLDHSTILFGSNMSNSDKHNNDPLPAAILGHANGKIKGGQHVKYPQDSRFADLLVTLFDRNNIPVEKLGDSGGILSEI